MISRLQIFFCNIFRTLYQNKDTKLMILYRCTKEVNGTWKVEQNTTIIYIFTHFCTNMGTSTKEYFDITLFKRRKRNSICKILLYRRIATVEIWCIYTYSNLCIWNICTYACFFLLKITSSLFEDATLEVKKVDLKFIFCFTNLLKRKTFVIDLQRVLRKKFAVMLDVLM